ncbi:MAG: HAD family hydrolase [Acidobacteriota bacterium]
MTEGSARPRAVIFDFDGVILESTEIKTRAFAALFADRPEHREAILRHHQENVGFSRYRKFDWIYRKLFREPLDEATSRHLGERYSAMVFEQVLACPLVPGAQDLLEDLVPTTPLFVASGTPDEELQQIVDRRGLRRFFREVHGAPRGKTEILLDVLGRHGWAAAETLMVGDGMSDLDAAEAAGVPFVGREIGTVFEDRDIPTVSDLTGLRPFVIAAEPERTAR